MRRHSEYTRLGRGIHGGAGPADRARREDPQAGTTVAVVTAQPAVINPAQGRLLYACHGATHAVGGADIEIKPYPYDHETGQASNPAATGSSGTSLGPPATGDCQSIGVNRVAHPKRPGSDGLRSGKGRISTNCPATRRPKRRR